MDDLISRAAAIDYLMTNMGWRNDDGYEVDDADEKRAIITDLVNGIPTVDAIPIRQLEYYNDTFDGVLTIGNALKAWKDKRFPFFSDHDQGGCNEEV